MKRDVIRTVTPGTVLDDACLDAGRSNYLCGVYLSDTGAGLAACDISTGRAQVTYFTGADRVRGLVNELGRFSPAETVLNDAAFDDPDLTTALTERFPCHRERLPPPGSTPTPPRSRYAPSSATTRWPACPGMIRRRCWRWAGC